MKITYSLLFVLVTFCAFACAQLDICTVTTTSSIPFYNVNISTNVFNDFYLFGNMCPLGYVKLTDQSTNTFSCKALDEFLLETVDKKNCSIPYGDPFYDPAFPYIDEVNCVLPYLGCSPTTLKCTYIQTRMIDDKCSDRMNCYGYITNPFINCYNEKCTLIQENPVLVEGSVCPFSPDSDFASMLSQNLVNYVTNTYDSCDNSTYCHLPSTQATQRKCLRKINVLPNDTCGLASITEDNKTITVYKKCPDNYLCDGTCKIKSSTESACGNTNSNTYLYPDTPGCLNYTTAECTTYEDCLEGSTGSGISLKQSLDTSKWPQNQPARCESGDCIRLFGKKNGEACLDNTDCHSSYCNTTYNICTDLPSEITCGETFYDPSEPPCPMYSYCGCSASKRVCVDFCMGKLMDLVVCSMDYGMLSSIYYQHPLQPMQDKLLPLLDVNSSVLSPNNGKCSIPLKSYLNCVYANQINNNIDARLPSTFIGNLSQ